MPRGRQPGARTLSVMLNDKPDTEAANRQQPPSKVRYRQPPDRRARPQRWNDAVADLLALQAEYAAWYEGLPDNLRDNPTGEALEIIVDLDLDALAAIVPPRGYGRD